MPHATPIPNTQPPQLNYTPFLAGGSEKEPHLYLCRVKDNSDKNWYYGYQADGKKCLAPSKNYTSSEIIVFKVVNNN